MENPHKPSWPGISSHRPVSQCAPLFMCKLQPKVYFPLIPEDLQFTSTTSCFLLNVPPI